MHIDRKIHSGEGTLPEGYYRVIYRPNPLTESGAIFAQFHQSANLAEVIERLPIPFIERSEIYIEGTHIPRDAWRRVRPNAGVDVVVQIVPGAAGLVSVLSAVAGSMVTSTLGGLLGGFASTLVGKLLITAAGAVVSGLVAQGLTNLFGLNETPQNDEDPINPDIRGARNQANFYGAVPVVLGTHRMAPLYGGMPYTETHRGKQYLRLLMVWGYGPVEVSDIKFGEQRLGQFDEVEQENDYAGTENRLDLYPRDAEQQEFSIELEQADGYWKKVTSVATKSLAVSFVFPRGLYGMNKEGARYPRQVEIKGQYRRVGASSWTDWFDKVMPASPLASTAAVYRAERVTGLTEDRYEVRIKRMDQSGKEAGIASIIDGIYWTNLNSFGTGRPINLDNVAKSAFRIQASDQLQGVVDQLNAIVSLKVPTWNGSAWTGEAASSNPAAIYRWILTGPANANALASSRIDNDALGEWYEHCEDQGYTYNRVVGSRMSVKDILHEVAAAGFASPSVVDNKWSVVVDKERSTVVQHFTPRNTANFQGSVLFPEVPHAIRMRFINKNKGYIEDERIVYDDGYTASNASKYQVFSVPGITEPRQAFRMARHILAALRLRPEVFSFETDVEGLIATRGDLIRFTHDVPKIGTHYGRVVSISGDDVTLDEHVVTTAGSSYTVRFRQRNGNSLSYQYDATESEATNVLTIPGVGGLAPGVMFQFGPLAQESVELLVQAIEPGENLAMRLTCIPYQEGVYSRGAIPDYETIITTPDSLALMGPRKPRIKNIISDESVMSRTANGSVLPAMVVVVEPRPDTNTNARSTVADGFRVRYRLTTDTSDSETLRDWRYTPVFPADDNRITISGVRTGETYDVSAMAIGANSAPSEWTSAKAHTVVGAATAPPALDNFSITTQPGVSYLEWEYTDAPIDLRRFVIKYHHNPNVTDWLQMAPIARSVPYNARSYTVPTRAGSYAIRAIDVVGNQSPAIYINTTESDQFGSEYGEPLETFLTSEDPGFTGTRTGTFVNGTSLALDTSQFIANWTTLADVVAMGAGNIADETDSLIGYYEFGETDLGGVFTQRIMVDSTFGLSTSINVMAGWTPLAAVDAIAGTANDSSVDVEFQIAISTIDSATPSYDDWRRFDVAEVTARHVKFRVALATTNGFISPTVVNLDVRGEMFARKQQDDDISSGAGAKAITFDRAFYQAPSLAIAAQNMQTGDYYAITGKSATGFTITFRNAAGTAVDRTFDWTAIGYGRESA